MTAGHLREAMEAAKRLLDEEAAAATRPGPSTNNKSRKEPAPKAHPVAEGVAYIPAGGPPPIPYTPGPIRAEPREGNADVDCLRKDFPAISHWPEEMLRSQPVGDLAKANAELEYKMGRSGRPSLEAQLDNNFQQLLRASSQVPAGPDNQITVLHPARFMPGMLCATTDAWLQAREVTPKAGLVPYGQYDVQNLGFSRQMSAKGWAAIHNPGHGNLSIKLFSSAASRAASERTQRESDCFSDLEEFKTALRAASLAQSLATPWNFSIAAIEGFLHTTKYGFKFFKNQREHVRQLTAFVDWCFEENARRWNLRKPFLINTELTNEWNVFTATLSTSPAGQLQRQRGWRNNSPPMRSRSPLRGRWEGEEGDRTCSNFNRGSCRFRDLECMDRSGALRRHLCSVRVGRNGAKCGKKHPAKAHP